MNTAEADGGSRSPSRRAPARSRRITGTSRADHHPPTRPATRAFRVNRPASQRTTPCSPGYVRTPTNTFGPRRIRRGAADSGTRTGITLTTPSMVRRTAKNPRSPERMPVPTPTGCDPVVRHCHSAPGAGRDTSSGIEATTCAPSMRTSSAEVARPSPPNASTVHPVATHPPGPASSDVSRWHQRR